MPHRWSLPGLGDTSECPAYALDPYFVRWFTTMQVNYARGLLPVAGGVSDQPSCYIQAFDYFAAIQAELDDG